MFGDLPGAVRDWGNSLPELVGPNKPLALGLHERRLRSPSAGCYALITALDGDDDLTAERLTVWSTVIATIYSATDAQAARLASYAYMNELRGINVTRPVITSRSMQLLMVGHISSPSFNDDEEPNFVVTADVHAVSL